MCRYQWFIDDESNKIGFQLWTCVRAPDEKVEETRKNEEKDIRRANEYAT